MRVLFDTNIYVSYLLTLSRPEGAIHRAVRAALSETATLLLPREQLEEFREVLVSKPYIARRVDAENAAGFVAVLGAAALLLPPIDAPVPQIVRDPKDDYLLAHALLSRADYLVTGDRDLLVLERVEQLRIGTPTEFVEIAADETA